MTTTFGPETPNWTEGSVTLGDGTLYKEIFGTSGWQRGLTLQTETWSGGVKKRWSALQWIQDNTSVSYQLNPRVAETNVYDDAGNHSRTTTTYTSFGLPSDVYEYDANATTVLRRTHTDYNLAAAYTSRRIIGLLSAQYLYDGSNNLFSKVTREYDLGGIYHLSQGGAPVQHDTVNYGAGLVLGRANLNIVRRWDITDPANINKSVTNSVGYNLAGSVVFTRDPLNHETSFSYTDSFSDQVDHNTRAYPTKVTDADNHASLIQYNYDFGAVTRLVDPKGAAFTRTYDAAGRLDRITNQVNNAYTRFVYLPNQKYVQSFTTIKDLSTEFYAGKIIDGHGRLRAEVSDHPTSAGQYKVKYYAYDAMGRMSVPTNWTEINGSWAPTGDDPGYSYTIQAFDWNGRPTVFTNQDGVTRETSYHGCGCAGGQIATFVDEAGRRRDQTSDILGRMVRERVYNWGGSNGSNV